jgi:hypothetical protein
MTRNLDMARASVIAASLAIGVAIAACGSADGGALLYESPPKSEAKEAIGSLALALRTTGNFQFANVEYKITRGAFSRSGNIDVSNSTTVSAIISPIPAAAGYTIALTTSAVANPQITCAGSSPFDVVAGEVTPVQVDVQCREPTTPVEPPPTPAPIPRAVIPILALLLQVAAIASLRRRS